MTKENLNKIKEVMQSFFSGKYFDKFTSYQDKFDKAKELINLFVTQAKDHFNGVSLDDPEIDIFIAEMLYVNQNPPIIFEPKGFHPWLNDVRNTIEWNFWNRYQKYLLTKKNWNWSSIRDIDETTDVILDHLVNPKTDKGFRVKGLVLGDIQSGKTANYTGLINKAVDAGFKMIIVLAGLTNDLRYQTQMRLDKEFIGKITKDNQEAGNAIGVGLINAPTEKFRVQSFTYSDETTISGDFKKITSMIPIDNEMPPTLLVVKKNSSVLKNVINYISKNAKLSGGKIDIPILMIDDEVDQASVNTKVGNSIEEATSINRYIRTILSLLNRYAYIGYTATPFANVFINTEYSNEEEKDIYPEDFIISIPTPRDYSGIREFFGNINKDEEDDYVPDLIIEVEDEDDILAFLDEDNSNIPDSMIDAFMHFIISSAVKRSRGILEHNTMLIHISSRKYPANKLKPIVEDFISNMFRLYKYDLKDRLRYYDYWISNLKKQTEEYENKQSNDNWASIEYEIFNVFELLKGQIVVLNSDSLDYIDYESTKQGQHIAIGGNKLSRGLTLEGLITSYYFRRTGAFDTLLQMGRWFGYRVGWIDLCRIYTSSSIKRDFLNVADAIESFKQNILEMNHMRLTPLDFQIKVKTLPQLAPTAASKMRNAKKIKVAYSNTLQQTITFDLREKENNRYAVNKMIQNLKEYQIRKNKKIVFKHVTSKAIIDFLNNYHESEEYINRISIKLWINYIILATSIGELTDWTVILSSKNRDELIDDISGFKIAKSRRSSRADSGNKNIILTRAISDPADFKEFYDENSPMYKSINSFSQSNDLITSSFTSDKGVLSIYDIDLFHKQENKNQVQIWDNPIENGDGVIGLAIWFSKSSRESEIAVDYYVNKRYENDIKTDIYGDDEND